MLGDERSLLPLTRQKKIRRLNRLTLSLVLLTYLLSFMCLLGGISILISATITFPLPLPGTAEETISLPYNMMSRSATVPPSMMTGGSSTSSTTVTNHSKSAVIVTETKRMDYLLRDNHNNRSSTFTAGSSASIF